MFPAHKKLNAATIYTIINAAISLRIYFINFEYWIMHIKEHAIPNIANDVLESIVAE